MCSSVGFVVNAWVSTRSHPEHKFAFDRLIIFSSPPSSPFRGNCEAAPRLYAEVTRRRANDKRGSGAEADKRGVLIGRAGAGLGAPEPAPCLHPCPFLRCESCGTAAHRRNSRDGRALSRPRSIKQRAAVVNFIHCTTIFIADASRGGHFLSPCFNGIKHAPTGCVRCHSDTTYTFWHYVNWIKTCDGRSLVGCHAERTLPFCLNRTNICAR